MNLRRPLGTPSVCFIRFHIANDIADEKPSELNISLVDAASIFQNNPLFIERLAAQTHKFRPQKPPNPSRTLHQGLRITT
jgi:hypothetical protein